MCARTMAPADEDSVSLSRSRRPTPRPSAVRTACAFSQMPRVTSVERASDGAVAAGLDERLVLWSVQVHLLLDDETTALTSA